MDATCWPNAAEIAAADARPALETPTAVRSGRFDFKGRKKTPVLIMIIVLNKEIG